MGCKRNVYVVKFCNANGFSEQIFETVALLASIHRHLGKLSHAVNLQGRKLCIGWVAWPIKYLLGPDSSCSKIL